MAKPVSEIQPGVGGVWGNGFEAEHTGFRSRQKRGDLPVYCKIDLDTFRAALGWWCDAE